MQHLPEAFDLSAVPLFPLPGVVLFPRAILPLHIFEQRYKMMTADAIAGDRLIAVALLKSGWEKCYYNAPAIEPVVCVGRILSHELLPDGKYNFLLQGLLRCTVLSEDHARPYRRGQLEPLLESQTLEIDLVGERQRLLTLFSNGSFADLSIVEQFRELLCSPLGTAEIADLLAFHFIECESTKQSLLSETDVPHRVQRVVNAMEAISPIWEAKTRKRARTYDGVN